MTRHWGMSSRVLVLAALCATLGACPQPGGLGGSSGQVVRISPAVWSYYQQYADRYRPLYFAVSPDGEYAGYNYCNDQRCINEHSSGRQEALSLCEELSSRDCLIFAYDGRIQVPYEIKP